MGVAALLALVAEPALAQCRPPVEPTDIKRALTEAPAMLASAGARCEVTDAALLGRARRVGSGGKGKLELEIFEAACKGDLGLVIIHAKGEPDRALDCLLASMSGEFSCRLAANRRAGGDLEALLREAGANCNPVRAVYRGELPAAKRRRYEVVCDGGQNLLLDLPQPRDERPAQVSDCMHADIEKLCELAEPETRVAAAARRAALAVAEVCRISDVRLVGRVATRNAGLYELACGADQPGLFVELSDQAAAARLTPCARTEASYRLTCQLKGKDEVAPLLAWARNPASPPMYSGADVDWAERPNGDILAQYYPPYALRNDVSGRVHISCAVMPTGRLDGCDVALEEPMGYGFGDATLRIANRFRMRAISPGIELGGQMVRIPVNFCG